MGIAAIILLQHANETSTFLAGIIGLPALGFLLLRRSAQVTVFSDHVEMKNAFGTSDILRSQIEMVDAFARSSDSRTTAQWC